MILLSSLLMGLILGVSAHRAGLCTVKAVAEVMTSRRGWFLWSFLKAALWVTGLVGLYGVMGGGIALRQWPLDWIAVLGGLIFGLGAGANGACVFSTLARLAEGHGVMLLTLAGWAIGIAAVHLILPDLPRQSNLANPLPAWMLLILGPWMIWEGARILQRLMREGWGQIGAAHWPLSLSVALVAVANFGLLSLDGAWSFTSTLICSVKAAPLVSCANDARLWLISSAAILGMTGSAFWRGSFRLRRVRAGAALRHSLSGLAMGAGAALIPGGNDGLILFGLPALSPHALPALASIVTGTALSMVAMRAFDWPMSTIRCEADICRATL
ncbi:putative membrane protein YedE/YeeE [Mesorhizobium jarvisii]